MGMAASGPKVLGVAATSPSSASSGTAASAPHWRSEQRWKRNCGLERRFNVPRPEGAPPDAHHPRLGCPSIYSATTCDVAADYGHVGKWGYQQRRNGHRYLDERIDCDERPVSTRCCDSNLGRRIGAEQ